MGKRGGLLRVEAVCKMHGRVRHPVRRVGGEVVPWRWGEFSWNGAWVGVRG